MIQETPGEVEIGFGAGEDTVLVSIPTQASDFNGIFFPLAENSKMVAPQGAIVRLVTTGDGTSIHTAPVLSNSTTLRLSLFCSLVLDPRRSQDASFMCICTTTIHHATRATPTATAKVPPQDANVGNVQQVWDLHLLPMPVLVEHDGLFSEVTSGRHCNDPLRLITAGLSFASAPCSFPASEALLSSGLLEIATKGISSPSTPHQLSHIIYQNGSEVTVAARQAADTGSSTAPATDFVVRAYSKIPTPVDLCPRTFSLLGFGGANVVFSSTNGKKTPDGEIFSESFQLEPILRRLEVNPVVIQSLLSRGITRLHQAIGIAVPGDVSKEKKSEILWWTKYCGKRQYEMTKAIGMSEAELAVRIRQNLTNPLLDRQVFLSLRSIMGLRSTVPFCLSWGSSRGQHGDEPTIVCRMCGAKHMTCEEGGASTTGPDSTVFRTLHKQIHRDSAINNPQGRPHRIAFGHVMFNFTFPNGIPALPRRIPSSCVELKPKRIWLPPASSKSDIPTVDSSPCWESACKYSMKLLEKHHGKHKGHRKTMMPRPRAGPEGPVRHPLYCPNMVLDTSTHKPCPSCLQQFALLNNGHGADDYSKIGDAWWAANGNRIALNGLLRDRHNNWRFKPLGKHAASTDASTEIEDTKVDIVAAVLESKPGKALLDTIVALQTAGDMSAGCDISEIIRRIDNNVPVAACASEVENKNRYAMDDHALLQAGILTSTQLTRFYTSVTASDLSIMFTSVRCGPNDVVEVPVPPTPDGHSVTEMRAVQAVVKEHLELESSSIAATASSQESLDTAALSPQRDVGGGDSVWGNYNEDMGTGLWKVMDITTPNYPFLQLLVWRCGPSLGGVGISRSEASPLQPTESFPSPSSSSSLGTISTSSTSSFTAYVVAVGVMDADDKSHNGVAKYIAKELKLREIKLAQQAAGVHGE